MPIWPGLAKALIRTGLAQRIPSIQRVMGDGLPYLRYYNRRILASPNVELKATQAMLEHAGGSTIDLTTGAPNFAAKWPKPDNVDNRYPAVSGLLELRQAIAEKLEKENGLPFDPRHQILVCNGVSQAIGLMLDTFADRRGKVAVFDPTFFIYRMAAQNRELAVHEIPTWTDDGRVHFQENRLKRALRGASVLFLNSPSNPTGGIFAAETLERIAYWCHRYDVLIFADEVYERYIYAGEHTSIASMSSAASRTITANSFSKSYGMAGSRVGYLAGPRFLVQPMIVSYLATAPFVSATSQAEATLALRSSHSWFPDVLQSFRQRRDHISRSFRRIGLKHEVPWGAFFFWIDLRSLKTTGASFASLLLDEQQVLVMPGESCGRSGRDYVRLSFAGAQKQLEEGISRIGQVLESHFGLGSATNVPPPLPIAKAA